LLDPARRAFDRCRRPSATTRSIGWLTLFLTALFVASAVPVLAAESRSDEAEGDGPSPSAESDPPKFPTAIEITAGIEKVEQEEAEEKAWLEGPEATRQREESQTAYAELDASAATTLVRSAFSGQLEQLNGDPARILSDAQLVSSSEETAATISLGGKGMVMESFLPVRAEDDDGDLRKVDLGLERTGNGYETENGLVEVHIPEAANKPIKVGEEGVSIKLAGADAKQSAHPYGDTNVFASEVLPDTDMLVSPIATGVEISNVLRSEDSPETLRYEVEMPAGAVLQADGGSGYQVVRDGESLATIPKPTAVDAQGTEVPVGSRIEGASLVLTVEHRGAEYAMPILVDPILENGEGWIYWANLDSTEHWSFTKNVEGMYGSSSCIHICFEGSGKGLYVSAQSGFYWPNQDAHWAYGAPNANSYVLNPTLSPYVRYDNNCSAAQYPQPHDYFGVWGANGQWVYLSVNSSNQYNNAYYLPYSGQSVVFGLNTAGAEFSMPCWRDLYAGGATVWLDDSNWPSASPVQNPPTTWIKPETPVHIVSQASDSGLGVQKVVISSDGAPEILDKTANQCTGTWRSRCLTGYTGTFDIHGASFREGKRVASVVAFDATGKASTPYYFETKVDGNAPEVKLEGQLAEVTHENEGAAKGAEKVESLQLPVYNLKIEAADGHPAAAEKEWQSGVRKIEIKLDEIQQKVWQTGSCAHDCSMTETYPVDLSTSQTAGKHTLKIVATDFAGNPTTRNIEFRYYPATGMKDEYVMQHFPLPDGGSEEEGKGPELAVNVMNGNLVYHETDVDVQGPAELPLEVERYYNSLLPNSENTEWGDGWTLAQTPALEPIPKSPGEAEIVDQSGVVEGGVPLPAASGTSEFDPSLQATVTKTAGGGYELDDATGETPGAIDFNAGGQAEALVGEGHAEVEYEYEGGKLAGIEVSDPATFSATPSELQIPEPQLITQPAYASSFGSVGAGEGQLKAPADVAVDPQGNVWVVDRSNNRVEKFDPSGKFLMKFGSAGSGNGQFNRPTAITIASNGDLLVTDAGNDRVERFNSAGAFLAKFGASGTGNGQFGGGGPEGIAIDAAGNIWVSDTYGGRLEKFSSAGAFLQSVGTKGSGSGQLGEPTGLDIAPNGEIWVADWQNNRISRFNAAGAFVSSFGSLGTGNGQFHNPDEVKFDKLGDVWIGDQSNARIEEFDLSGQFKAKFGSAGSGQGQFNLSFPMGIATDSKGRLWIADTNNNRVQQWSVPIERPTYTGAFGSLGTGNGQLQAPADIAIGVEGSLWVVDKSNNRIEKFSPAGGFLAKFGSAGSGDGQFNRPTAIAVDRDGDLLVTDSGNNRVEKFDTEGHFLSKFGAAGAGKGQFSSPEGVAGDFEGNIWVADSGNGRIEEFNEEGSFLSVVGSKGSGSGQLGKPIGIDVDAEGDIWVADLTDNRISVFEPGGGLVRQFGTAGTGPGQFNRPSGLDIDRHGNVWVTDLSNQRVQSFDLNGNYVGQFGGGGSGEGQFSFPTASTPAGLAADVNGGLWIADVNNERIQHWQLGNYQVQASKPLNLKDGDPKVEVETSGGLVDEVTGNAAGTNTYVHAGDDLTRHVDAGGGETKYEYDSAGRMTKVTLPNGTAGSIAYTSDGRVKSVTVDPAGSTPPKTTEFVYQDAPTRRTTVVFPDAPHVIYDISASGAVVEWWNAAEPPVIEMTGNLYDASNRETQSPVSPGAYILTMRGSDAEGIASIDVIVNGNQLVNEWKCPVQHPLNCVEPKPEEEWVMETGDYAPGILYVEVLVTDQTGESSAKRFWVNIPQPPPPSVGAPTPPKFNEVKRFREEYGLEVNFPVSNKIELDERIFNLIGAWNNPNSPEGQVARASWESWGVPLRPEDIAELAFRERYLEEDGLLIEEWAEAHHPGTYAGYQMDDRSGGLLRIGFTENQAEVVSEFIEQVHPSAADRIATFSSVPPRPLDRLEELEGQVTQALESNSSLNGKIASIEVPEAGGSVSVETTDVAAVEAALIGSLGSAVGVNLVPTEGLPVPVYSREHLGSRIAAGDRVYNDFTPSGPPTMTGSTAGFGARETQEIVAEKRHVVVPFMVTAGHTGNLGTPMYRVEDGGIKKGWTYVREHGERIGRVGRDALTQGTLSVDALALRLQSEDLVPKSIVGAGPVSPPAVVRKHEVVCQSGSTSDRVECGRVIGFTHGELQGYPGGHVGWFRVKSSQETEPGDSGGPVWSKTDHSSVGVISAVKRGNDHIWLIQPLLTTNYGRGQKLVGALNASIMGSGSLTIVGPGE
jgi:YD repeat-containing protein